MPFLPGGSRFPDSQSVHSPFPLSSCGCHQPHTRRRCQRQRKPASAFIVPTRLHVDGFGFHRQRLNKRLWHARQTRLRGSQSKHDDDDDDDAVDRLREASRREFLSKNPRSRGARVFNTNSEATCKQRGGILREKNLSLKFDEYPLAVLSDTSSAPRQMKRIFTVLATYLCDGG